MKSHASFYEAIIGAAASLRGNKLRSFLTLLGIILATTTLIAVMSVIQGMNEYIAKNVSDMGADGFRVRRIVMIGEFDPKKFLEMQRRNPELSREEFDFLRSHASMLGDIAMEAFRNVPVQSGKDQLSDLQLIGASPNLASITNRQILEGRFIAEIDDNHRLPVAVIGADLKKRFFEHTTAVGKIIHVQGRPFEVIGAAKPKGSVFGQSQDGYVMIPVQTYFKMFGARQGLGFNARAIDHEHLFQAQDEVRMLMRSFRHLRPNQDDTFGIASSDTLVTAWTQLTGAISATAIGVVSVFLVVGGVVIMNIMLAVVTERTHEIGIRKSVGARRRDILRQFLVESAMLASSGGFIGVLIAYIVAVLIRTLTPVPMSVPLSAVVIGVLLSASVGLFFGIYPAQRAARLDPIEALRVER
jgi:putative ABC transport system permease protein